MPNGSLDSRVARLEERVSNLERNIQEIKDSQQQTLETVQGLKSSVDFRKGAGKVFWVLWTGLVSAAAMFLGRKM